MLPDATLAEDPARLGDLRPQSSRIRDLHSSHGSDLALHLFALTDYDDVRRYFEVSTFGGRERYLSDDLHAWAQQGRRRGKNGLPQLGYEKHDVIRADSLNTRRHRPTRDESRILMVVVIDDHH
jgi:hypothetical protein